MQRAHSWVGNQSQHPPPMVEEGVWALGRTAEALGCSPWKTTLVCIWAGGNVGRRHHQLLWCEGRLPTRS